MANRNLAEGLRHEEQVWPLLIGLQLSTSAKADKT